MDDEIYLNDLLEIIFFKLFFFFIEPKVSTSEYGELFDTIHFTLVTNSIYSTVFDGRVYV